MLSIWLGPSAAAMAIKAVDHPSQESTPTVLVDQAALDERAPLYPQEAARFGPGKGDRTARRVFQVTGLLSQGGALQPTVRHLAAVAGVSDRTIQRAQLELESKGLTRRVFRKVRPRWNRPNVYRFLARERQMQIFNRFVTQSRKNLTTKASTPKNSSQDAAACGNRAAGDHPAAMRAAWEARRRQNHPPELRERFEERAAMWKHMRGWRPQRKAQQIRTAARAVVGMYFESDQARAAYILDRCGLSLDGAEILFSPLERELFRGGELDQAQATKKNLPLDQAKGEQMANIVSPFIFNELEFCHPGGGGDLDDQDQAADLDRGGDLDQAADRCEACGHRVDLCACYQEEEEEDQDRGGDLDQAAAVDQASTCERCDGKRRTVYLGRIIDCPSCSGGRYPNP
jgi:hypothetical protein